MSLTNALQTGKTSLLSSQTAIEVTGTNIANVNTTGYSRQSAEFSDYPALLLDGFFVGQGVDVDTISREHDAFLETQLNSKSIDLGYQEARSNPLSAMEQAVSISDSSLSSKIDEFFASWQSLATNPSGSVERENVIQQGTQVTDAFHSAVSELESISTSMDQQLEAGLESTNDKLSQVADLNVSIAKAEARGYTANSDLDARDLLVRELAQELGAVAVDGDDGMVNLTLPAQGDKPEVTLVDGATAGQIELTLESGEDAEISLTLGGADPVTVARESLGGELQGALEIRDVDVPEAIEALNTLASTFAEEVNAVHLTGKDSDGNAGTAFFVFSEDVEGSAAGIELADDFSSSRVVAGTSGSSGDNEVALEMAGLGSASWADLKGTTFVGYYGSLAASIGTASSQNELALEAAEDSLVQLENMRDAKVGVSLEDEMINLMQFQQGFEASARFISTVDEMMDTILGLKG